MMEGGGRSGPAPLPGGREGTSLHRCPGLPAVPEENVQADRDVTAERNARLFLELLEMRSGGNKRMEMKTRMDGVSWMVAGW